MSTVQTDVVPFARVTSKVMSFLIMTLKLGRSWDAWEHLSIVKFSFQVGGALLTPIVNHGKISPRIPFCQSLHPGGSEHFG